jgi:predicted transcriptional regulator
MTVELNKAQLATMNLILQQKSINQVAKELGKSRTGIAHHLKKMISNKLVFWENGKWHRSDVDYDIVPDAKLYGRKWRKQHNKNWEVRHLKIDKKVNFRSYL